MVMAVQESGNVSRPGTSGFLSLCFIEVCTYPYFSNFYCVLQVGFFVFLISVNSSRERIILVSFLSAIAFLSLFDPEKQNSMYAFTHVFC